MLAQVLYLCNNHKNKNDEDNNNIMGVCVCVQFNPYRTNVENRVSS